MKKETRLKINDFVCQYYKQNYPSKMGGSQTIVLPNGYEKEFDDRQYYSGRGAKYNNKINHNHINTIVTNKEYQEAVKILKTRERNLILIRKSRIEFERRIRQAKRDGIYSLITYDYGTYVELSDSESENKTFDSERLANTLDISKEDCELLQSKGKTYVYARNSKGETIELYHSDLSCNRLSISVDFKPKDRYEEMLNNRDEFESAPYAKLVGQTSNINHFVC